MARMFICGIGVVPMTLGVYRNLLAQKCAFVVESEDPNFGRDAIFLLWCVSTEFRAGDGRITDEFIHRVRALPAGEVIEEIFEYLNDQFCMEWPSEFDLSHMPKFLEDSKAAVERAKKIVATWSTADGGDIMNVPVQDLLKT